MASSTYFVQGCFTCGRNLRVRVEYLGKQVVCQHCGARFEACDPSTGQCNNADSGIALIERADKLLKQSGIHLQQGDPLQGPHPHRSKNTSTTELYN